MFNAAVTIMIMIVTVMMMCVLMMVFNGASDDNDVMKMGIFSINRAYSLPLLPPPANTLRERGCVCLCIKTSSLTLGCGSACCWCEGWFVDIMHWVPLWPFSLRPNPSKLALPQLLVRLLLLLPPPRHRRGLMCAVTSLQSDRIAC